MSFSFKSCTVIHNDFLSTIFSISFSTLNCYTSFILSQHVPHSFSPTYKSLFYTLQLFLYLHYYVSILNFLYDIKLQLVHFHHDTDTTPNLLPYNCHEVDSLFLTFLHYFNFSCISTTLNSFVFLPIIWIVFSHYFCICHTATCLIYHSQSW